MPKDPLDIIAQDAKATASLFDSINANVRAAAAAELGAARAASGIIDTTFRAKQLKRATDQQIRSRIIQDDLAQRVDDRAQANFELSRQLAPLTLMRQEAELKLKQAESTRKEAEATAFSVQNFLNFAGRDELNRAFDIASNTGNTTLLKSFDDARSQAALNIMSGKMKMDQAAAFLKNKFKESTGNISSSPREYKSSDTVLIGRLFGPEAAARHDLEFNPNRQADRRAESASVLKTGTRAGIEKHRISIKNPSERERFEKAYSKIIEARSRRESVQDVFDNFFDKGLGRPRENLKDVIETSEGRKPFNLVPSKQKEEFLLGLQNRILDTHRVEQAALESIRAGTEISEDLFEVREIEEESPVPNLSKNKATQEDRRRAGEQIEQGPVPAITAPPDRPLEAIRKNTPLQSLADAKIASASTIKEFGIPEKDAAKLLKGIDIKEHELDRFSFLGLSGKKNKGGFIGIGKVDSSAVEKIYNSVKKFVNNLDDEKLEDIYLNSVFSKELEIADAIFSPKRRTGEIAISDIDIPIKRKPRLLKDELSETTSDKKAKEFVIRMISETITGVIVKRINNSLR